MKPCCARCKNHILARCAHPTCRCHTTTPAKTPVPDPATTAWAHALSPTAAQQLAAEHRTGSTDPAAIDGAAEHQRRTAAPRNRRRSTAA